MRKKRIMILCLLAIVAIVAILVQIASSANIQARTPDKGPELPTVSADVLPDQFVIPENPLGPVGLVSAVAMALGVFYLVKQKNQRRKP